MDISEVAGDFSSGDDSPVEMPTGIAGDDGSLSDEAVDARLEAFMKAKGTKGKAKGATGASEPEEYEDEVGGEEEGIDEPLALEDEPEELEEEPVKLGGSKEKPLKHKDLPDNQFVEVSINGEKQVLSIKELAEGNMRQRAFNQRISQTKGLAERAKQAAEKAESYQKQTRQQINQMFGNPEGLREFMLDHFPEQLEKLALAELQELIQVERLGPREQSDYWTKRKGRKAEKERARAIHAAKRQQQEVQSQEAYRNASNVLSRAQLAVFDSEGFDPLEITQDMKDNIKALIGNQRLTKEVAEAAFRKAIKLHRADNPAAPATKPKRVAKKRRAKTKVEAKNPRSQKSGDTPRSFKQWARSLD